MSTDRIAKSGPTCPYSTLPGFVRATRLLLGILPAVAFATVLTGCQLVPTDLSDSPITSTPASDRATTGSREVGVPEPQTQMQMVDEVSVSDDLPDICQKIRDVNQIDRCLSWRDEIINEIYNKKKTFHDSEFNRRIRIESEDHKLKNIFSIIHDMKEHGFDEDVLLRNVASGRYHQRYHAPNEFRVTLSPSSFWGESSSLRSYLGPEYRDDMEMIERTYQESLYGKDIVISVDILIARNNMHLEFAQTSSFSGNITTTEITAQKEILIHYHIIDFKNSLLFEGILREPHDDKSEDVKRKRYTIGSLVQHNWSRDLKTDLSDIMRSNWDEDQVLKFENSIHELQLWRTSEAFVPAWKIVADFLSGSPKEKRIPDDKKGDRGKVFQWIDEESISVKKKISLCQSQSSSSRNSKASMNSSDENILNPNQLMKRIVHITSKDDTGIDVGTGFYVDDNLVLTNHHVITRSLSETHGLPIVELKKFREDDETREDDTFYGVVVGYDSWRDLALLSVEEAGTPFLIYKGDVPPRGTVVSAFGNPRRVRWIYTRGVVSGYGKLPSRSESKTSPSAVITDAAINKGNSGGPLVYAGKVVGVNTEVKESGLFSPTEGLNYAVRYDEIHAFLRQQGLDLFEESGQIVHDEDAILKCVLDN